MGLWQPAIRTPGDAGDGYSCRDVKVLLRCCWGGRNRDQKRIGPVFGGRCTSENVEDDSYLRRVLRYIHANPVKAKLVVNAFES